MKKSINQFALKTFLMSGIFVSLFAFTGCGGGNTDDSASAAQSMVPDEPKDDGQGIGKFKDVTLAAIDNSLAEKGKVIFEAKCVACHRTSDQKIVGPGLKGVTAKRSPAWILNMITNPEEMTKKDPTAKDLLAEHLTQMTFQDVSDEEAKQILEYLRVNDSEGAEQASK